MARTEQVSDGLVVKQKEQSTSTFVADKSVTAAQLSDEVSNGLIPIGAVIPVMTHLSGAFIPAATGVVSKGLMLCDGASIPAGNTLLGTTPNLSNDAYLRGSGVAGAAAGANNKTLNTPQLPSHNHSIVVDADNANHGHTGTAAAANAPHAHPGTTGTANAPHGHPAGGVPTSSAPVSSSGRGAIYEHFWVGAVPSGPGGTATGGPTPVTADRYYAPHSHSASPNGAANAPHSHSSGAGTNNAPHSHTVVADLADALHAHTATAGTTGSGDSINFEPNYITCVYVIRVR